MELSETERELGQFIPLHYHHSMLLDEARMSGFRAAIDYAVQPGARVLELGGGTGVLSFFAAQKAAQVWCVERNPVLVETARRLLAMNAVGNRVEVVQADAFDYLPPEPVDVVICEMLHVALLREKQIPVLDAFKRRYLERFGAPLPRFVPEACLQAVQPLQQDYRFEGYYAPVPLFQNPVAKQERSIELAAPAVYQSFAYDETLPEVCAWHGSITAAQGGTLDALRFVTKNILAVVLETRTTIDWHNAYLVLPVDEPIAIDAGTLIDVEFSYRPGEPLDALRPRVSVSSTG